MNFQDAVRSCLTNYANFSGRAVRSEFWFWTLFCVILGLVTAILDSALFPNSELSPLYAIAAVLTIVPSLAVGARRLHDIDRTGWWQLIAVSIIGLIVLIYWYCKPGQTGGNRFGETAPITA